MSRRQARYRPSAFFKSDAATHARGARWVNIVFANVKRAINGCYHAARQRTYVRRYLAEAAYRFNRRFHLPSLLPRLARTMMLCKPCAETHLRAETNFLG